MNGCAPPNLMTTTGDTGVSRHGDALEGCRILFGISGGIAATEAVRLGRELGRHGGELTVIMTPAACKVITPLAVGWACRCDVLTDWKPEMSHLDQFDAVLVSPLSRNLLARFANGMMDHPLLMAMSAARGRGNPILLVPSMHNDLFDDPITPSLLSSVSSDKVRCMVGPDDEGRRKQPEPVDIVAELCNFVNSNLPNRKRVAITLGANRAPIDAVRAIQNASSGATGWTISEHLHRMGHQVICIAGKTSAAPAFQLPDVRRAGSPDHMLEVSLGVAKEDKPECWIHAAAVLDYYTEAERGKKASGADSWELSLKPGPKHIRELAAFVDGAIRIGFKLETGIKVSELHERAHAQIAEYGVDAVVANLMEQVRDSSTARAHIVHSDGSVQVVDDESEMCKAIDSIITG